MPVATHFTAHHGHGALAREGELERPLVVLLAATQLDLHHVRMQLHLQHRVLAVTGQNDATRKHRRTAVPVVEHTPDTCRQHGKVIVQPHVRTQLREARDRHALLDHDRFHALLRQQHRVVDRSQATDTTARLSSCAGTTALALLALLRSSTVGHAHLLTPQLPPLGVDHVVDVTFLHRAGRLLQLLHDFSFLFGSVWFQTKVDVTHSLNCIQELKCDWILSHPGFVLIGRDLAGLRVDLKLLKGLLNQYQHTGLFTTTSLLFLS
mmetsp:Transcript_3884/g.9514  ORF Transcript_3884/g.9514 Transcript_3884/m.9514 type:complete len:265 (-) Transcript_3884:40-834(-)